MGRTAKLAIHALTSLMNDAQTFVLQQMQYLGECPAPWTINSEIGSLAGDAPPHGKLFRYLRYDVRLELPWIEQELGPRVEQEFGRKLTEDDVVRMRSMDDPTIIPDIYKLAQHRRRDPGEARALGRRAAALVRRHASFGQDAAAPAADSAARAAERTRQGVEPPARASCEKQLTGALISVRTSLRRLNGPLAIGRHPFGAFAHRLLAKLQVDRARERGIPLLDLLGQQLASAPEQHAHPVVLAGACVKRELFRIIVHDAADAGQEPARNQKNRAQCGFVTGRRRRCERQHDRHDHEGRRCSQHQSMRIDDVGVALEPIAARPEISVLPCTQPWRATAWPAVSSRPCTEDASPGSTSSSTRSAIFTQASSLGCLIG